MDTTLASTSRYKIDFEELALLGRGGFGFVTKCRSRLSPDCIYAVKCIQLGKQCDSLEFMLREASNLARLHHKNVVRYFTAWLEKDAPVEPPALDTSAVTSLRYEASPPTNYSTLPLNRQIGSADWSGRSPSNTQIEFIPSSHNVIDSFWQRLPTTTARRGFAPESSTESEAIGFAVSSEEEEPYQLVHPNSPSRGNDSGFWNLSGDSHPISFEVSQDASSALNVSSRVTPNTLNTPGSSIPKTDPSARETLSIPEIAAVPRKLQGEQSMRLLESHRWTTTSRAGGATARPADIDYEGNKLYIVMEYVQGCTLRKLILDRLCDDPSLAWDLFGQILEGLSYMHKNSLLHRDVKPENIFLRTVNAGANATGVTYQVKIGDLGLSKTIDSCVVPTSSRIESSSQHASLSSNVGTHFYIAPEVEAGARYNQAADMYALGVVLYEMFHAPFETTMERFKELTKLQKTREVSGINDARATLLISQMLNPDPKERPTASALLEQCVSRLDSNSMIPIITNVLQRPYSYEMLKILATLFNRKETPSDTIVTVEPAEATRMRNHVHRVMRSFNAIYYDPPVLLPYSEKSIGWFDCAIRYIDTSGSPLQPPSCFGAVIKSTLSAVQNATVVRRYTVHDVVGASGDVTICPTRRLHAAFDVITNCEKLRTTRSSKEVESEEDYGVAVLRETILEMEPIHVALSTFKAFRNITEE